MEAVGIVVEYNPFHKGHFIHLQAVREKFPEDIIIAVMSGDYVQRGEPAIISKERRAKQAKEMGVDIIVELPAFYSTQSAEIFARSSIGILTKLDCKAMVFGSESNDLKKLERLAILSSTKEFDFSVREYLAKGFSYPTAVSKALFDEKIEPNDILGVEYLKAIHFWKSSMKVETVSRKQAKYYEENAEEGVAGAAIIRQNIKSGKKYSQYLVDEKELEKPFIFWEDFYSFFRYYILFQVKNLSEIQDMETGLEQRILKAAKEEKDYSSFLEKVLTKRYTNARLQRVFLHILLGLTKGMTQRWKEEIPYIRILEFSEKGQEYLRQCKKKKISFFTTRKNITQKLPEEVQTLFFWNEKATEMYHFILEEK